MNIPNNLLQMVLVNKNLQFHPFMESLPAIYITAETNTDYHFLSKELRCSQTC